MFAGVGEALLCAPRLRRGFPSAGGGGQVAPAAAPAWSPAAGGRCKWTSYSCVIVKRINLFARAGRAAVCTRRGPWLPRLLGMLGVPAGSIPGIPWVNPSHVARAAAPMCLAWAVGGGDRGSLCCGLLLRSLGVHVGRGKLLCIFTQGNP